MSEYEYSQPNGGVCRCYASVFIIIDCYKLHEKNMNPVFNVDIQKRTNYKYQANFQCRNKKDSAHKNKRL